MPSRAAAASPSNGRRARGRRRRRSRGRAPHRRARGYAPRPREPSGRRCAGAPRAEHPSPSPRPRSRHRRHRRRGPRARPRRPGRCTSPRSRAGRRARSAAPPDRRADGPYVDVEAPGARRYLRPAHEEVGQERLQVDLLEAEPRCSDVTSSRSRSTIRSIRPSSSSATSSSGARLLAPQQLEMAARDRDRSPQLVRRVLEEALLALEQRGPHLGHALNLGECRLPPAAMPDEPEEDHDTRGITSTSLHSVS